MTAGERPAAVSSAAIEALRRLCVEEWRRQLIAKQEQEAKSA